MSTADGETTTDSGSTRGPSPAITVASSATMTPPTTSTAVERKPSVLSVTSGTMQYLNPDYAPPLTVSLDVNNSPLAMLARTCNNIGKDQPLPAPSRTAPRGVVHFQQHHHHPTTVLSTGKSSSPSSTDNAKKSGVNSDVATGGASNRKDFTSGVPISSRNKFANGLSGVAVGRTTASPLSSSSSPPSTSSAGRLPVRSDETTHSAGLSRVFNGDRVITSSGHDHRNNDHPIRPTAVSGLAGMQNSRRRLPVPGGNESIYDIYRHCNGTGRMSPAPYSKTISTVLDDGEDEDCNVEDDDEMLQDAVDDEMETGNRSIGSSMEAIEHMMQRYVADVQAEAQRRGSVQRLLQHNREAVAFQTALAAAASASYHQSRPQSALGLLGHSGANTLALGGGMSGRHLQSGGLPDPALYSALVAVAASQYHRQQQQQQSNRGDVVNGASPTSTSTSSFCSPNNKDSAASNEDRESPSMACDVTESEQQLRHQHHQQQQRHHRRHHVRHRSNVDDGFRVPPALAAAAATAGNPFSGLLLQAAAAANGFPMTGRNDSDAAGSVPPLPTSTTPGMACNWMTSSGEFCGRRFGSSDELLHHLQSHVLQGHPSSTSPTPAATDNHQLAAALAAGLFQSPLHQYHCANAAAAAAAAAGLSSSGGILPPGYPLLFGAGNHPPHLPPHLVAALTNQGLASSLPSAAGFSQHRSNHHHQQQQHQQQQQQRERSGTGKSPPPNAHGSSLLLHAAAVAAAAASRYHPYKLPQSSPAGGSAGAFSPLSRSGLRHLSPPGVGPNAVDAGVPSLAAYLSSSPYGSSLYPAQRLGPAVGP